MNNQFLKRLASAFISGCLLLSGQAVFADTNADNVFAVPTISENRASENENVRIIVELKEEPLLAYGAAIHTYAAASDFLSSKEAKEIEQSLAQNRTAVKKALVKNGVDLTVTHEYSAVINGFSVEASVSDLQAIKETDGVKDAFIAEFYSLPEPINTASGGVSAIGSVLVGEEFGYTGKNSAVAILDTGLDLSHPAFASVNSPKYSKDDIEEVLQNNKMTIGKLNVSKVYINDKIPYAYDYADVDTNVSGGDSHGTHVAGIVGANSGGVVEGVAPDAQLFIMKVFGDETGGAYDDDILAALDDSVKFGVDAINMSLGITAGFSESAYKSMREVYDRVKNAGIALYCAAGNEYSSTYENASGNDLPKAAEPDNGVVASPSTYEAALSVASMNNTETTSVYFLADGKKIRYNDSAEKESEQFISLSGTFEYVDCGVGATADFAGKKLTGKIALIQRAGEENGEILAFAQKEAAAKNAGALAAIIYDNVSGSLVNMTTDHKIPCIFISKADGEYLCALADKRLSVSEDYIDSFTDDFSGKMSDFSSWGVTPDLKLKPEITAPGGDIYSTLPGGLYGNMSGTSMASPHMAGASAVMSQYLCECLNGLNMTLNERTEFIQALLLSTAVPVKDENGVPYSPRKQGAGLASLSAAVQTKAYLLGADGGKPKAEMGYNTDSRFAFDFTAVSFSDADIEFEPSVTVLTEDTVSKNGILYMAQKARVLSDEEVTVTVPKKVSVSANGKTQINVKLELTEKGKANLNRDFPNGIYIEGFVTLNPVKGTQAALSYPFMGFFGDWEALAVFDSDIYDDTPASLCETRIGQFRNSDGGGYLLGHNYYVDDSDEYNADKIAIKGGETGKNVTAAVSLLRNVDKLTFSVDDSDGNTVYSESLSKVSKTYHSTEGFYTPMAPKGWAPFDTWNAPLDDGKYTYKITAVFGSKEQTRSYPIVIDSVSPEVLSSKIEGSSWIVTVHDNHYIQGACATANGNEPLTKWLEPDAGAADAVSEIVFDLSAAEFKGLSQAKIALIDYAGNTFLSDYYSLSGAEIVYPASVSLDKTSLSLTEGESTKLTATVLPANASNRTVLWRSSDENVAEVSASGVVTAKSEGSARITAETSNGLTAGCLVTVKAKESENSPVSASVTAPKNAFTGNPLFFELQLESMKKVATVSFTFEKDALLEYSGLTGKNGFTPLGIKWNNDNTATVVLSYLENGAGGGLTKPELCSVAELTFKELTKDASVGLRLTAFSTAGYDENGKAVYLATKIATPKAETAVSDKPNCDVNGDGKVDLLDITYCQKYYRQGSDSSDWSDFKQCDLDGDGLIGIQDLIIILQAM